MQGEIIGTRIVDYPSGTWMPLQGHGDRGGKDVFRIPQGGRRDLVRLSRGQSRDFFISWLEAILSNHKKTIMFQAIKQLLSNFKENRTVRETAKDLALKQADLSEKLMLSLGIAMKLKMRVYIRIDVGNQSHGISVQGQDDPTLQFLHDLASENRKACVRDASEAELDDRSKDVWWTRAGTTGQE